MFYIHVHIQQQVLFNAVIEAILMSFYEELFELNSSLVINTATIIIYWMTTTVEKESWYSYVYNMSF